MATASMYLILDFDRTLFDTDRFKAVYEARLPLLLSGEARFSTGELTQFVYPDVISVLRKAKEEGITVVLLTFGDPTFQKAKVLATGLHEYFDIHIFTFGEKGQALFAQLGSQIQGVFVDDLSVWADSVKKFCPNIRTVRINRSEENSGVGVIPDLSKIWSFFPNSQ